MNDALYLGVDGGQSSTTALIGDAAGKVIAVGRGGPCNHVETGDGRAKFVCAIRDSLQSAGFDAYSTRFASACLGFSGGPVDKQAILEDLLSTGRLMVTDDARIALAGATAGEAGVIVIAGTGSIAYGRSQAGITARAGGWGYVFGDEGGGFDLTRQALRAALRFEEGWGPPTSLRRLLLAETQATDTNDLLHRLYTLEFPRPRIAAMSKLVNQAAAEGDAVARKLLYDAAQLLAELAGAVRRQLFPEGEVVRGAYVGGVFGSALLLERFRKLMELSAFAVGPAKFAPAAGALIEAYRADGLGVELSDAPEMEK